MLAKQLLRQVWTLIEGIDSKMDKAVVEGGKALNVDHKWSHLAQVVLLEGLQVYSTSFRQTSA